MSRGELFALVLLIRWMTPLSDVEFVTDNEGVFKKINGGPCAGAVSSNCDLYNELFKLTIDKAIRLNVRWMPSHLKEENELPPGVSLLDIKGNGHADELAGQAARQALLPSSVTVPHIYYVNLVKRIQLRLATIVIYLPHRQRDQASSKNPQTCRIHINTILGQSHHDIHRVDNRISCLKCSNSFGIHDAGLKSWAQCPCPGRRETAAPAPIPQVTGASSSSGPPINRPARYSIDNGSVHVGNHNIHFSHKLYIHRGLRYCSRCGYYATDSQARGLVRKCVPPKVNGRYILKCIASDKLPRALKERGWPDGSS